ncbi:hypothetical protein Q31b_17840 [Novipirellula aureliae]|uniref:Chondroitin AC lyase n=1 Tax=Novipirellula aureliae TaxID=2527966 RepID=A0A5C6E5Z7_9BACT|nr:hypothetical protein [Novipirellula aureliae]TWU44248.1 hypothetical protein Q31b_17840 [Novipirellula aureliae]
MDIKKHLVCFLSVVLLPAQCVLAGNIIDTADYPYWRQLASSSPFFAAMKSNAIDAANNGTETRDVMGGCALAYILDPENRAGYIDGIKEKFGTRITNMTIGTGAATSSVPSHELFYALLALDVIRSDLDSATLRRFESVLKSKIMDLYIGKWDPHAWAMRMLWYKYIGDERNFQAAKVEFDSGLSEHYMPNDGVSPAGNGYCVQRWNSVERSAKNATPDLMEYMGYHEYYTNPGIIGLKEFMYGYAVAPFGRILLYGDSRSTEGQVPWDIKGGKVVVSPHILSAARYSPKAYQYAMWVLREGVGVSSLRLKGHLSNYLIMAGTAAKNDPIAVELNDGVMAPSRLFQNYAAFISKTDSTNALYMSMLNLTGNTEYHTHFEVNALAMAGYGEILLRNAGYSGPDKDVTVDGVTATFDYLHSNSESANTVMIGGARHSAKVGDGITEGFVGQNVEYCRGVSTTAIEGTHARDVVFVQPSDGAHGYYLVMDHVTTDNAGENVNVVWHPNSGALKTVAPETHYLSEITKEDGANGPRVFTENEVELTTFLATPPSSVEIKRTANQASRYSYAADYLVANYDPIDKRKDILTVLFPADKTHQVGELTRIESEEYTGCKIVQEEIEDVALTSDGSMTGQQGETTFQGEDVLLRTESGKLSSFFVKGVSFDNGQRTRCGFQADLPIAIYMNAATASSGMRGIIHSNGTKVTFYYPEITSVKINEHAVEATASGQGWVQIQVPSGTFKVEIVSPHTL